MSKQDQAARIARREYDLDAETVARNNLPCCIRCRKLERAIRKYGNKRAKEAVRKERERCVGVVVEWCQDSRIANRGVREPARNEIIDAIRKGKA